MKKIKSMLELFRAKYKKPAFEQVYQQLKQEVLIANQSKQRIWGMLVLNLGIVVMSFIWATVIIYQHFHDQDIANAQETPHREIHLGANRLFLEPPQQGQSGFHIPYQLAGILFDKDIKKREVMLLLPSGVVKSYHVGEELPDGVKILDIEVFQVKLEKDGQQKILKLEQYKGDFLSDKPKSGQSLF
jgi:hypothetical protein